MMKRLLIAVMMTIALGIMTVQAAPTAQDEDMQIDTFEANASGVSLGSLQDGSARVPVSWSVSGRDITQNLYFEQYLPDTNRWVNVELPRAWEWVNSEGTGVVAPFNPGEDEDEIRLRLAVKVRSTDEMLINEEITVPIITEEAAIVQFEAAESSVSRGQLAAESAHIEVTWQVANRPETANLYFEQYQPEADSYTIIELPRPWEFVSSSGTGMIAPILPDDNGDTVRVRLSVRDMATQTLITEQFIDLTVTDANAQITTFSTGTASVTVPQLQARSARVVVNWDVANRPANSNLVFDQVMPDGALRNVELPRPDPFVASSGTGLAAPYYPGDNEDSITLQLRLVDLSDRSTITSARLSVPIAERDTITVNSFDAQPRTVEPGGTVTVSWDVDGVTGVRIAVTAGGISSLTEDAAVEDLYDASGSIRVSVPENVSTLTFEMTEPANRVAPIIVNVGEEMGDPVVTSFDVQPRSASSGDRLTVNWDIENVNGVQIMVWHAGIDEVGMPLDTFINNTESAALPAEGTRTLTVPQNITSLQVFISSPEGLGNQRITVPVTLVCSADWYASIDVSVCPTGAARTVTASYQPFENGYMVWFSGNIWAVGNDDNGFFLVDTWDGRDITFAQLPPEGRELPVSGFGWAWTQNQNLRDMLGWATEPEQGFNMQLQQGTLLIDAETAQTALVYMATLSTEETIFITYGPNGTLQVEAVQ